MTSFKVYSCGCEAVAGTEAKDKGRTDAEID